MPFGVAHEHVRAAAGAAQRALGHGQVVAHDLELGDAGLGEVDLVGVRDRHLPPAHVEQHALGLGRHRQRVCPITRRMQLRGGKIRSVACMGTGMHACVDFSAALPALLTLAACATSPTASSVPAGGDVLLRPGESVTVEGTGFAVRFDAVANDSRCPARRRLRHAGRRGGGLHRHAGRPSERAAHAAHGAG